MIETTAIVLPVAVMVVVYFIRLETRLTKILTDLCWIKKELVKCQPNLEESSR